MSVETSQNLGDLVEATTSILMEDDLGDTTTLTSLDDLDAQARNTTLYRFALNLHFYWLPIAIPIGFVGNILAFSVLLQPHNRRLSCCLYMAALAASDTVVLADAAYFWTCTVPLRHTFTMSHWECKTMAYILAVVFFNGVLLILSMTVDRFIAIRFPLKAAVYCTPRRAKITISIIFCVSVVYALPQLHMAKMVGQSACASYSTENWYTVLYSWISFCSNCFIPFFIILGLNIGIITTIHNRMKYFKKEKEEAKDGKISQQKHGKAPRVGEMSKTDTQLTAMLLIISFMFLVLTLPQYTRYALFTVIQYRTSVQSYSIYILCFHVSNKCYYTNSAVNFFLYCIGGSKFRQDLRDMLCGKPRPPVMKLSGAASNSSLTSAGVASNSSLTSAVSHSTVGPKATDHVA